MSADKNSTSSDTVRTIGEQSLQDSLQIVQLIELIRTQNSYGINERLARMGANQAALALRNAMIGHLSILIARAYAPTRRGDLHCRVAVELFENDQTVREIFQSGDGGRLLAQFLKHWKQCTEDARRERVEHFRHKFTAHLSIPKDTPEPEYRELFGFGMSTAQLLDLLALTTKAASRSSTGNNKAHLSASAFWEPWFRRG